MRQVNFKKGLYKYYSPFLFKLYKLRARFDLWLWGMESDLTQQLAEIYWCHYIRKKMSLEAKFFNCKPLPKEPIFEKTSDVAYILGCGASINDVTAEEWKKIDSHFSIGLNLFFVHKFTPSLYFTEFQDCPELCELVQKTVIERNASKEFRLCIAAHYIAKLQEDCFDVKDTTVYFYPKVTAKIKSKSLLKKIIPQYYTGYLNRTVLLHHRSNLDSVINYCVNLGYKDIRLVGVDLSQNKYFFDDDATGEYSEVQKVMKALEQFNRYKHVKQSTHATADTVIAEEQGCFTIDEYLSFLQQEILTPMGVRLSVTNPESLLASKLNVTSI